MADAPAISPLRDLRYRAEYLGLRILIGLVRLFPIDVAGVGLGETLAADRAL